MKIRLLMKEENGQSLVMVAIFIVVLLGFTGLVIDGGRLYLAKSQLQKAVDAGALAGADLMLEGVKGTGDYNHTESKVKAVEIADSNYDNTSYNVSFPNNNIIRVYGEENVNLMLMPILGKNIATVSAEAQVQVGGITRVEKGTVIPLALTLSEGKVLKFGETWNLKKGPGEGYNGNFHFLDLSTLPGAKSNTGGAQGLEYYIKNASTVPIKIGQTLFTEPGQNNSSKIEDAINDKANTIVYVPIIEDFTSKNNGASEVTIIGFAAFKLLSFDKKNHVIQAEFIKEVLPGEMGDVTTEYGTYASKLIH